MKKALFVLIAFAGFAGAGRLLADSGAFKSSKHSDPVIGAFRDINLPRGNCSQCHLQHDSDAPFDFGLFAPTDNSTCLSSGCHEYEYQWPPGNYYWSFPGNLPAWYNSAHGSSSSLFPSGNGRETRLCIQCHNPHGDGDSIWGVYPSATGNLEERGCYSNGAIEGQGCHGMNGSFRPVGADDIYSQILKSSGHGVTATAKIHSGDWQSTYSYGRESRVPNSGFFAGSNWHVECVDCHNPHEASSGSHFVGSNEIGPALLGAWGVEPINGGAWVAPTAFNIVDFNTIVGSMEYQLCFKCHSYFAFGNTPPSGFTDNAREFNPANLSYHPVEDTIPTNSYTSPSEINEFIETMEVPWDNGTHDKMTCGDCHASDNSSDPRGPHGSNNEHILIGSSAPTAFELCTKCHKASVYAPTFDPGSTEAGSRFDWQTTQNENASHYAHFNKGIGCRQCHGGRQSPRPSLPPQESPYPIELGSLHGANRFPGLMNGTNISYYGPGTCTSTCHDAVTFISGPE